MQINKFIAIRKKEPYTAYTDYCALQKGKVVIEADWFAAWRVRATPHRIQLGIILM